MANPAPAVIFATSPYAGNAIIDFQTTEGRKHYNSAIAPIVPAFTGKPSELYGFLERLNVKANVHGWTDSILKIDTGTAANPDEKYLVREHGQITVEQCRAKAQVFLTDANGNRSKQSSNMLHVCLVASIEGDFFDKLLLDQEEYSFDVQGVKVQDGATMLKVMIARVLVDTRSTVSIIRLQLQNLPAKMLEFNSNIEDFNSFVKKQMIALSTRGESTSDILVSLFKGYLAVSDGAFVNYMTDIESKYEDGTTTALSPEKLMSIAVAKYKTMVEKKTWQALTPKDEQMIALKAELEEVKKSNQATLERDNSSTPRNPRNQRTTTTRRFTGAQKWKGVAPKAGESREKTVGGREYVHCPYHKELKWVLKEGHAKGCTNAPAGPTPPKKQKSAGATKEKQYAEAMAHIHDGDYDEESDDEGENA